MIKKGTTIEAVEKVIKETPGLCFLYKHSATCPVSHAAHKQVEKFAQAHPETLIVFLEVHDQRDLSNQVAELYEVKHESPQLLTFKDGVLKEVHNHLSISGRYLKHVVGGGYNGEKE